MVARLFRALVRVCGGSGYPMAAPSWPYDLGYVLPRSEWAVAAHPADRCAAPLSPREREAFLRLTAELAE
jgi:hypothetical protein